MENDVRSERIELNGWGQFVCDLKDGNLAVCLFLFTSIFIFNIESHQKTDTLTGHEGFVNFLHLLPNRRLLSGSRDNTVIMWDLDTRLALCRYFGHSDDIWSVKALRNGTHFLTASNDKTLRLWTLNSTFWRRISRLISLDSPNCERVFRGHQLGVTSAIELRDGRIASSSLDTTIKLWDLARGVCEATWHGHQNKVISLIELSDGRLASASKDSTIRLWDVASGNCVQTLRGHQSYLYCLAELSNGNVISGSDHDIRIWDVNIHVDENTSDQQVDFKPQRDGAESGGGVPGATETEIIVSASLPSSLRDSHLSYEPSAHQRLVLRGHTRAITSIIQLDDQRIVSCSWDQTMFIWTVDQIFANEYILK